MNTLILGFTLGLESIVGYSPCSPAHNGGEHVPIKATYQTIAVQLHPGTVA